MSILKIKRLHPQAQLPARATDGSAGHDLYACIEQPTEILPGQTVKDPDRTCYPAWRVGNMWR